MASGKFIAYYRVSTNKQGASGLGIEAQKASVESYLNGGDWDLIATYTDIESGTRKGNNRPELRKALAHAKREKATLVIAKLDRLARNVAFVSNLMESGVDFVAADLPHANRLTIHIMAAMAEYEAEMISVRTKAALAAAKERGQILGKPENLTDVSRLKGAKSRKNKALNSYAHLASNIINLKEKGLSFRKIAAHLNECGEVTSSGLPFQPMTIKRIYDRATSQ